jgi:hypothetical protein
MLGNASSIGAAQASGHRAAASGGEDDRGIAFVGMPRVRFRVNPAQRSPPVLVSYAKFSTPTEL